MAMIDAPTRTQPVHYRTASVEDQSIFYRDAGPTDAPALVLLHGFPTSSNMFRNLIPRLSGSLRLIAPDYPGFGQSSMPDREKFEYTFDNFAGIIEQLLEKIGVQKYSLYVVDYGAPVGFRLALRQPDRVQALVIQNGNAYEEGLNDFWNPIRKLWENPTPENRKALHGLVELKATISQYETGVSDTSLLDPTAWLVDQVGLDRPGNREIQMDLFYDYRTNVALYPKFQEFFRTHQPPALIVWGKNDAIFPGAFADLYERDLHTVEKHLLDGGHFALETHADEIAMRIEEFFSRQHLLHG